MKPSSTDLEWAAAALMLDGELPKACVGTWLIKIDHTVAMDNTCMVPLSNIP